MGDDLIDALRELVGALERAGIDYALGGATALGVWSVPNLTMAIDVNLWCAPDAVASTLAALLALGVEGDLEAATAQAEHDGVAYLRWRGVRLDVFLPSIDFYAEARRTRVRLDLPGVGTTWLLSAEALAVFKLLFFRGKDIVDLEKLVRVRGDALDRSYIRAHVAALVGETDERIVRWDAITRPQAPPWIPLG